MENQLQTKPKKPKRTLFGKIVKYTFIAFNIIMLIWLIRAMMSASDGISELSSDAEQAGAVIGTGIGAMLLIFIWVAGDIILGIMTLLTRAK